MNDDLTLRTVVFDGDIDDMGVVIRDSGGEAVEVKFPDKEEYIPRDRLEDVTEMYDYAFQWGLTTENHAEED